VAKLFERGVLSFEERGAEAFFVPRTNEEIAAPVIDRVGNTVTFDPIVLLQVYGGTIAKTTSMHTPNVEVKAPVAEALVFEVVPLDGHGGVVESSEG
jgi:hypothetical protein